MTTISQPGVYQIPAEVYHADPVVGGSLSSTGARKLLPPSCPALFRHDQLFGQKHARELDLGSAAHVIALGEGADIHVVGFDDYRTNAAKEERDEAHARGAIPLLPDEFDVVQAMAAQLRRHPRWLDIVSDGGASEQTLVWVDPATGVWCRARPDWMSPNRIVDYKTSKSAALEKIPSTVANYGYHVQEAWYWEGAIELDLVTPDVEFLFVFQEKTPPYLVTFVELDDVALKVGRERMRRALEIYRDCRDADVWPGYSSDIEPISLPTWVVRAHESEAW